MRPKIAILIASALLACQTPTRAAEPRKFDFGTATPAPGHTQIATADAYSSDRGFGFAEGAALTFTSDACVSERPFLFLVDVPEGNYRVTVTLGDAARESNTTIKAESRRLMLESVATVPGKFETGSFIVNVRRPEIVAGGRVTLTAREAGPPPVPHWDDKLTIEFNGKHPAVSALEIAPVTDILTVYLAGDSTVTDQVHEPYAGWGQMLPRFFRPDVVIANHAESGLALSSFRNQHRLEKILSALRPGDYVFVQFGHNDQKDKAPGAGPFTTYKERLEKFVADVREKRGVPVLVTSMERRRWSPDGQPLATLSDFAEAVRQVGREKSVPVIDLHAMSLKLYAALGPEASKKAFVHFPAGTFPEQVKPLADDTHHSPYGGYELAKCVVEGIKAHLPELASHLLGGTAPFDPAKPDPIGQFAIPASPLTRTEKPAGN
jgi:lysophospholipase L1-like esterase